MPTSEHFVNVVYGFATSRKAALASPSLAVCFEVYIEKPNDAHDGEVLVLSIKGMHIHSTNIAQVKKMISYTRLLDAAVSNSMCRYFVDNAFNEIEMLLNNNLLTQAMHFAREDSNEQ